MVGSGQSFLRRFKRCVPATAAPWLSSVQRSVLILTQYMSMLPLFTACVLTRPVVVVVLAAQSGWVFPTVLFIVVGVWSTWSSLYLSKALQMVRGNHDFNLGIEFSNAAKQLFPPWGYYLMLLTLIFNFQVSHSAPSRSCCAKETLAVGTLGRCVIMLCFPMILVS
jgi:hypothetical protein